MDLYLIFQNLGIFAILISGLAWFAKSITIQAIDKNFEKYKSFLQNEQMRFSKLHEKRAEVIEELYTKLVNMEMEMASLICPLQLGKVNYKEKIKKTQDIARDFVQYYNTKRIFLCKDMCELIDSINERFKTAWIIFTTYRVYENDNRPHPMPNQIDKDEKWSNAWKEIDKEIPKIKAKLEYEFREILGVKKGI